MYTNLITFSSNINIQMNAVKQTQTSTPILFLAQKITCTFSRNRFVIYYELPAFPQTYRSIDNLTQLLLTNQSLKFKILDLEHPNSEPVIKKGAVTFPSRQSLIISMQEHPEGTITVQGKIINRASEEGVVFSMNVADIAGYLSFLQFRHKYKTLENVTRKQQFKLDYRLKVKDGDNIFYFNLEESDTTRYFFINRKLEFEIEEIFSIDDWQNFEVIHDEELNLKDVTTSIQHKLQVANKLTITLNIEYIKNSNFAMAEMVSLRVLQVNDSDCITIGTDKHAQMACIYPLMEGKYYDYEYGYLNKNLSSLEGTSIYDYVNKLTTSFPVYPHFKNSKIIQIEEAHFIAFEVKSKGKSEKIQIPFVYILNGLNIIQSENYTVKFYMEFTSEQSEKMSNERVKDQRRFYEMRILDFWNLGIMSKMSPQFSIKIMAGELMYSIPFISQEIQPNSFRKQAKELDLKQQYGQLHENKYFLIARSSNPLKLLLTKTESINQFYLLDLFSSSCINFQITNSKGDIMLQCTIPRYKVTNCKDGRFKIILTSVDNLKQIVLICSMTEVNQKRESLRAYYRVMHRLEFTDNNPCDDVQYDMEIRRVSDNKKYKAKIQPQISEDGISTLRSFEDGFFQGSSNELDLLLTVRKMYYSEQTQNFDNSQVMSKRIIINPAPNSVLQKNAVHLNIDEEGYNSMDIDFYDENIKKRLKLHFQVVMIRNELLDLDSGVYTIKIPQFLWKLNNLGKIASPITMETHLSHKKKRGSKVTLFPDSPQEYTLPFYNYKDGISISVNEEVGYQRVIDAVKIKCEVVKNAIGWIPDSQWSLGIITIGFSAFHFLIKAAFDPYSKDSDTESKKSGRTAGKQKSDRSYNEKIDSMAKTVKNMDLFNLKKLRNEVVLENRQLTAKFVQRQEKIIALTKRIQQTQEAIFKKRTKQQQITNQQSSVKKNPKPQSKMIEFYRSICQCGARNPKFNGFCEQCLVKLRKRYQTYLKEYQEKSYVYEKSEFYRFNVKEKLIRIKNKLLRYKNRIRAGESIEDENITVVMKDLQEKELKREIQECKIDIFRMQEERERMEEASRIRLGAMEKMIQIQDQKIWAGAQKLEKLKFELQDLQQKMKQK